MRGLWGLALGAACFVLAGCVAMQNVENRVLEAAIPQMLLVNNDLVRLDNLDLPKACERVAVAEKYYNILQGLLPVSNRLRAQVIIQGIAGICEFPPQNVVQAFFTLNDLWRQIQAVTVIPRK